MLIIQKFGGSSQASVEGIRRVAKIISDTAASGAQTVAVLSAVGDTSDILIDKAHSISAAPPLRELDALLSTGEISAVALMAIQLADMGRECISLSGHQAGILTDARHGEACILNIDCGRIQRELSAGRIVIVAGFQGASYDGDVTTLGRGGSDTTAVALAAALGADRCEIYSDVDGIYTADPRLTNGAHKLAAVDYEDMLLLASNGSQVLQRQSVVTAMQNKVEVYLLSSFEKSAGTLMTTLKERPALCGVTRDKDSGTVSVVGKAVCAETLAQTVAALASKGIAVHSGELKRGICSVTVDHDEQLDALRIVHALHFEEHN